MKTEWSEERLSRMPGEFEKLNDNTYMQRRNIKKAEPIEVDDRDPGYVCESRMISKDVYEKFIEALDSPAQQQVVNNFNVVTENQQISDTNTMIIMSAIADLFEKISN